MTVLSLSGPSLTRFTALTLLACVAAASTLALVGPNVDLPLTDLRQRQAPPPCCTSPSGRPSCGPPCFTCSAGPEPFGHLFCFYFGCDGFCACPGGIING
jgi:hypothetical protein